MASETTRWARFDGRAGRRELRAAVQGSAHTRTNTRPHTSTCRDCAVGWCVTRHDAARHGTGHAHRTARETRDPSGRHPIADRTGRCGSDLATAWALGDPRRDPAERATGARRLHGVPPVPAVRVAAVTAGRRVSSASDSTGLCRVIYLFLSIRSMACVVGRCHPVMRSVCVVSRLRPRAVRSRRVGRCVAWPGRASVVCTV